MATIGEREIPDWVDIYSRWTFLSKPEEVVLNRLRGQLPDVRMLDIGVGGGRTTGHFAQLVKEYVGIDYDEDMIKACKKRFPNPPDHVSFMVCDARSMGVFPDGHFDFILFSFQGLDYLTHDGRLRALYEIRRVGKPGSPFFFSTHNLNCLDELFTLRRPRGASRQVKALWGYLVLRLRNGRVEALMESDYSLVYDGVYSDKLRWLLLSMWKGIGRNYYIKPHAQVRQLEAAGFKVLSVYGSDGREIVDPDELGVAKDYWLHFLCENLG